MSTLSDNVALPQATGPQPMTIERWPPYVQAVASMRALQPLPNSCLDVGDAMNKRTFLRTAKTGAAALIGTTALTSRAQHGPNGSGPIWLTVSGRIGAGNRGALDPALDQMMVKQNISFNKAQVFDFDTLAAMPAITIRPTLEYDNKRHALSGPLLIDVMKRSGVALKPNTAFLLRAVDGYAARVSARETIKRRFVVATHLDGRPMALGGLGPLWAICDADAFPDMAAKPVTERFALCPWALYQIEVLEGR